MGLRDQLKDSRKTLQRGSVTFDGDAYHLEELDFGETQKLNRLIGDYPGNLVQISIALSLVEGDEKLYLNESDETLKDLIDLIGTLKTDLVNDLFDKANELSRILTKESMEDVEKKSEMTATSDS